MRKLCAALSSLRLTVLCLVLLSILVIWGTLYQVTHGLFAAQNYLFDAWFILIGGFLPFPGVKLVSVVFVVNMLAAAFVRFRYQIGTMGMTLAHLGVVSLLLGGATVWSSHFRDTIPFWRRRLSLCDQ